MAQICPLCTKYDGRVELAACKHMICSECFYEYQGQSSSACPVCIIEINAEETSENNCTSTDDSAANKLDDFGTLDINSKFVVVHGYKITSESWHSTIDKRLTDMKLRYEIYLQLFKSSNALFVHVPKAAGTSFEAALFDIRNRSQHAPISYWRNRIHPEAWRQMFKFAIVRHPFHRLISGYTYWKNGALAGQKVDQPFVHKCRTELDTLPKFVNYLIEVNEKDLWDCRDIQGFDGTCPVQFRPQLWFLTDDDISAYSSQREHSNTNLQVSGQDIIPSDQVFTVMCDTPCGNRECPNLECSGQLDKNRHLASKYAALIPLDYVGRYEDLEDVYSEITRSIDLRNASSAVTDGSDWKEMTTEGGETRTITSESDDVEIASRNAMSKAWPSLPHKRASLHSRDLPDCFQDPKFIKAVLTVYQCDFDAFGYSL